MQTRLSGYGVKPASDTDVLWNFEKLVIGRDGKIITRFSRGVGDGKNPRTKCRDRATS